MFIGHTSYSLFQTLSIGYHLATMHGVTDRQTDRWQYHANSRSYCVAVWSTKNEKQVLT